MKKLAMIVVLSIFAITGCITFHNSVPTNTTPLELEMTVKGSYKILGTTEASAEGMVILGFIRLGDFDKVAVFPSAPAVSSVLPIKMPAGPKTSIECAAAYKALENYPDADQVINPRWKTTVEDYVIFKKVSTTCTATAVKITHK